MSTPIRHLSLSVEHRICQILLERGWVLQDEDVPLIPDGDAHRIGGEDRPIVFLDSSGDAWPSGVRVYEDGLPVDPGDYQVNYFTRRITFHRAMSGMLTASILRFAVNITEGYPTEEELEQSDLPIVAYQIEGDDDAGGFGIGTPYVWETTDVAIDVLACNEGQRGDLTYHLRHDIRYLPLITYGDHQPRHPAGGLDPDFDRAGQFVTLAKWRRRPGSDYLPPRQGGSEKERWRSLISLEIQKVG